MSDHRQAVGEFNLIDWIRQREVSHLGPWTKLGIGDDCAILDITRAGDLLVTTDMLMDGRHFRLAHDGPRAVGYKALGVNLSDMAAMAGVPRACVVAVALPRTDATGLAQEIHAGMHELAAQFGVDLVGGDTNAWDGPLVVSVTLLGEATSRGAIRRSGRPARRRNSCERPSGREPLCRPPPPARATNRGSFSLTRDPPDPRAYRYLRRVIFRPGPHPQGERRPRSHTRTSGDSHPS